MKTTLKKALALLIASLFLFSLTACGGADPAPTNGGNTGDNNNPPANGGDNPPPESFAPTNEILNADLYSGYIQIGSKVLRLPAKYSDFIDAGAKFLTEAVRDDSFIPIRDSSGVVIGDNVITEDYLMDTNTMQGVYVVLYDSTQEDSKIFIRLFVHNKSDERRPLKDGEVYGLLVSYSVRAENSLPDTIPTIIFPQGIQRGTPLSELTEKWGEPTNDASQGNEEKLLFEYSKPHASTCTYRIGIDRNTSTITDIAINADIDNNSLFIFGLTYVLGLSSSLQDFCPETGITQRVSPGTAEVLDFILIEKDENPINDGGSLNIKIGDFNKWTGSNYANEGVDFMSRDYQLRG
jgi:hypothetical protein